MAEVIKPKALTKAIQPTTQLAKAAADTKKTVQQATNAASESDNIAQYMDKFANILDKGTNLIGQLAQMRGTLESIGQKKGVISREAGKPDNPELAQKKQRRDDYVMPPEDAPNLPGKPRDMPAQQEPVAAPVLMEPNTEFLAQCIDATIQQLKENVPETYKQKTVAELIDEYQNSAIKQRLVKGFLVPELAEICKRAMSPENQ